MFEVQQKNASELEYGLHRANVATRECEAGRGSKYDKKCLHSKYNKSQSSRMGCIMREGVRRNALRVLCLKSPHSEESCCFIKPRQMFEVRQKNVCTRRYDKSQNAVVWNCFVLPCCRTRGFSISLYLFVLCVLVLFSKKRYKLLCVSIFLFTFAANYFFRSYE